MDVDSCELMRADRDNTSRLVVLEMQCIKRETEKEGPRCQAGLVTDSVMGHRRKRPSIAGVVRTAGHRAGCPNPVRPPGERVLGRGMRWPDRDSRTLRRAGLLRHTEPRG